MTINVDANGVAELDANGDAFTTLADRAAGALAVDGLDPAAAQLITALVVGFAMDQRPETEKALRILSGVDEKTPADGAETAVGGTDALPEGEGQALPSGDLLTVHCDWIKEDLLTVTNVGWSTTHGDNLVHLDVKPKRGNELSYMLLRDQRKALALTLLRTL